MLRSNLCDYADAYIFVNGTTIITGAGDDDASKQLDERNKGVMFKSCAPFTKCISKINNTNIDNAQDIDIVMPTYNLIEYSDNYSKTSGSLCQYYKDDPNDNTVQSESFKSKIKITGKTPAAGNTKDVEITVPLKYLSNFWRTIEMPLINFEVNLILTWSKDYVITNSTGAGKFKITETKLYAPVVTLKFVLSFENENDRTSHSTCYLPKVEIKDYNVMVDGKHFFDQPINSTTKTYKNIRKIATGQGDDYTTGCLLDYSYFKNHYKMIATDLSKQQALDADPRAIQQINFTENLDKNENTTMVFIIEEAKETVLDFSEGTVKVL